MRVTRLLAVAVFTIALSCVHAPKPVERPVTFEARLLCSNLDVYQNEVFENGIYSREVLLELHGLTLRDQSCDVGPLSDASSDIVVQTLTQDSENVLAALEADVPLQGFVLKHIDATNAREDLSAMSEELDERCRKKERSVCAPVQAATAKALQEAKP